MSCCKRAKAAQPQADEKMHIRVFSVPSLQTGSSYTKEIKVSGVRRAVKGLKLV